MGQVDHLATTVLPIFVTSQALTLAPWDLVPMVPGLPVLMLRCCTVGPQAGTVLAYWEAWAKEVVPI